MDPGSSGKSNQAAVVVNLEVWLGLGAELQIRDPRLLPRLWLGIAGKYFAQLPSAGLSGVKSAHAGRHYDSHFLDTEGEYSH